MTPSAISVLAAPSLVAITGKRHGLGNRVRVVLGTRSLARIEARQFFYTWQTGPEFGARFDELWEIDERLITRTTTRILSTRFPYRNETLEWLDDSSRRQRVLQIRTPHALHLPDGAVPWEEDLRGLRPVDAVASRVRQFFDTHLTGRPYVGVMVRAHANSHAITLRESPIEWYIERMRQLREVHPDIGFFVSADTEEAQRRVVEALPGAVALTEKGGYNSRLALQASVADLYLLASSTHLLGPYFSSFPQLAQKLAGPDLVLETSGTPLTRQLGGLAVVNDPTRPSQRQLI